MNQTAAGLFHSKSVLYDVSADYFLSQSEFQQKVIERARNLKAKKIASLDHVILARANGADFLIDLFALWEVGAIPFICSPELTDYELQSLKERIGPRALLAKIDEVFTSVTGKRGLTPKDTAFVLFTSGTTARPKAVIHTFESLKEKLKVINSGIPPESRRNSLCALPLYFGHGLIGIAFSTLYSGGQLSLLPALGLENVSHLQIWLEKAKPTFISGTPAIWSLILRFVRSPLQPLLRAQIASAHTSATLFEEVKSWARGPVYNVYGMTETGSWISDHEYKSSGDENIVGDGKKWGTYFEIIDPDSEGIGEVKVKASGMSPGYWDYEGTKNPLSRESFQTGDYGALSDDKELKLIGRLSRIINKGGLKVSAEEVEKFMTSQKHILDAAVFGSGPHNSQLVALLVIEAGQDPDKLIGELKSEMSHKISTYKIPSEFKFVESIPRKTNGKPDLMAIRMLWEKS